MIASDIDETHDPDRHSWVASANGHADFPIQNLALGIFSPAGGTPRAGVAIGDFILDLRDTAAAGLLPHPAAETLAATTLNALLGLPGPARRALRRRLSSLLSETGQRAALEKRLHPAAACTLHLPAAIGDYTDFYAGIHHARTIGRLFRPDDPLLPNYKHIPIAYHGRASSIRPSGTDVIRPSGQWLADGDSAPGFGLTTRLDYELELGIWIGPGNELGTPIPIEQAATHIAGLCLLNDWSARDIQAWEYRPLGPFLAKSFLTTISPWIVTTEALAPFRIPQPARPDGDPAPLPYLLHETDQLHGAFAIDLQVHLLSRAMRDAGLPPHLLGSTQASQLYWTAAQMVTHHSSNGCNLNPGDLLGTGTIASPTRDGCGSLMELTEAGRHPITLPSGETRRMLEDGDQIRLSATAHARGFVPIGFGPCAALVTPPHR